MHPPEFWHHIRNSIRIPCFLVICHAIAFLTMMGNYLNGAGLLADRKMVHMSCEEVQFVSHVSGPHAFTSKLDLSLGKTN